MTSPHTSSPSSLSVAASDAVLLCQQTFRTLLDALARPCQPRALPETADSGLPLPLELALIARTLCDQDTTVWLSPSLATEAVRSWLRFHTGLMFCEAPEDAQFLLAAGLEELPELARLNQGTSTYPDRSATAIVANVHFAGPDHQTALTATGPGIRSSQPVPMSLTDDFLVQWQANHARFPQGVDCFFCGEGLVSGLPRTTVLHGQA